MWYVCPTHIDASIIQTLEPSSHQITQDLLVNEGEVAVPKSATPEFALFISWLQLEVDDKIVSVLLSK